MIQVMSALTTTSRPACSLSHNSTYHLAVHSESVQDHYCLVLAVNDASGVLHDFKFKQKVPIAAVPDFPRAD